jgi:hypothetical protein
MSATPSSFVNRLLRASLVLPQGNFPGTNSNTLVLPAPGSPVGIRMSAKLTGAGNFTNTCKLDIFGMRQVDMNAVTVLWAPSKNSGVVPTGVVARAILTLEALDNVTGNYLQVFQGQFQDAFPDYRDLPDVRLTLSAASGYGQQILSSAPSSFSGGVQIADLCAQLAGKMGFSFENNGVTGSLNTPYLSGTLMDQFRQVCEAGNIDYYFDSKQMLIICPKNQPRQGKIAVVLSPSSGLRGYVSLARFGIEVDCLWNGAIEMASPIIVQDSDVPGTNGNWYPFAFEHSLDSVKPQGLWFSHLQCAPFPSTVGQ